MSDDLSALRELAQAATPGPWDSDDGTSVGAGDHWVVYTAGEQSEAQRYADAAFIAAANPTAVLGLLDRLEAAEAAVERAGKCLRAAEWRDSSSLAVDFTGRPFASPIPQEDLRAALDAD